MRAAGEPTVAACATSGAVRSLRGAVVATSATLLAVLGHVLAGGLAPAPAALALLLVAAWAVATALGGRRWRLPSLLAVLVGAQVLLHVGLAESSVTGPVGPGTGGMGATGRMAGMGGMAGMGMAGMPGAPTAASGAGHGSWMLLAHMAAALLSALLLRRGEDGLWVLLELLTGGWRVPGDRSAVPVGPRRLRVDGTVLAPPSPSHRSSEPRRGPPDRRPVPAALAHA